MCDLGCVVDAGFFGKLDGEFSIGCCSDFGRPKLLPKADLVVDEQLLVDLDLPGWDEDHGGDALDIDLHKADVWQLLRATKVSDVDTWVTANALSVRHQQHGLVDGVQRVHVHLGC